MIILAVFKELKLVTVSDKGIINVSNDKTDLNKSAIYLNVKK
jgi:ssDNA-specific exonuclease RecJ